MTKKQRRDLVDLVKFCKRRRISIVPTLGRLSIGRVSLGSLTSRGAYVLHQSDDRVVEVVK